jgi:hypothetical protein
MAESILLLIILLIIIAISIGIYLYTQQNTTDDKSFSDRELNLIAKAVKDTQPIITTNIDTKLDNGNYVKTDDLTDDRLNIESNQKKIAEITDLRTTGDKGYTATTSTGETEGDSSEISEGQYQYIMQDTREGSTNKIELRNKVNIANDFNICNENKSVCYKFKVDDTDNLNIVKTDNQDQPTAGGIIYFKNGFELYDGDEATTENKYVKGPHPESIYIATPSVLNDQSFETQKSVYDTNSLKKQFLISNAIALFNDGGAYTEKTKQQLDDDKQYYIKINTGDDTTNNYEYHIMYPFSKLLQPILEYTYDGASKLFTMDYLGNTLKVYTGAETPENTIPTSTIQVNLNPEDNTATVDASLEPVPLTVTIKYIEKSIEKTVS